MRTTVTLDADVDDALREQSGRTGEPLKQLINRMIRAGLRVQPVGAAPYVPMTFKMGVPRLDLSQAAKLAADLEDEELIRRYRQTR
jgi:hypothetical protein